VTPWLLVILLGWTTFAFAGVYLWTLWLPALLSIWLVLAARPWRRPDEDARWVERPLALIVCLVILQLVPLPAALVDVLSPAARRTWRALALAVPSWIPLSIDPRSGAWAALIAVITIVVFVSARRLLRSTGIRIFARGLSAIGLIVSAVGITQDATGSGLMYWSRRPLQEGAPPFGPFVDRNSFATWVLLAIPLSVGYLIAHTTVHHRRSRAGVRWTVRLRDALDGRAIWLTASVTFMLIALAATLSRSGMTSLAVAVLLGAWLGSRRQHRAGRANSWIAAVCAALVVLGVARIDPLVVGRRFAAARTSAADRFVIWRETLPIVHDFWLTGTGAGTYETAMLVYQRSSPGVRFNQAHNHYLQAAAEGGVLLTVPLGAALWSFARLAARRLRADHSGMYWLRVGAACGLAAVAAQSLWDTGLTAPANAILAAIAAAIVVHREEIVREPHS